MKKLINIIKVLLSFSLVRRIRRIFGQFFYRTVSSTYILSYPFSILMPFDLLRENRAVLAGKGKYYSNILDNKSKSKVGLRRNIHRLEKGLIMRPRRKQFAKDYIAETVDWYSKAVDQYTEKSTSFELSELTWAQNVLSEYFSHVEKEGIIKTSNEKFTHVNFQPEEQDYIPFNRKTPKNLPDYDQILSLSMYRRSVRWFKKNKVPRSVIDKALLVARQSPTACNRMPYEFRIFDEPELVKKISNIPLGTGGYADNIPVIAVLVGKLDSYFSARDRHAIYVDGSLAAMSFVLALEVQGVSTCMINWPDFEPLERKMQKILKLDISERPIMLIAIGYPDTNAKVPRSVKKDLENIRKYNQ